MIGDVKAVRVELQEAWQRLKLRWEESKEIWDDPVRWQFERDFWLLLEKEMSDTLQEMEHLAQVIAQAWRSVE